MKVDLQTANAAPIKSTFAYSNVTNPAGVSHFQKLQNLSDAFEKTSVSFKGTMYDDREHVIEAGQDGIVHTLSGFARTCAYANKHKMPHQEDLDRAMNYFPLCAISGRSYAVNGSSIVFPSENEFVQIIKGLWRDSVDSGKDINMDVYLNLELAKKSEFTRMPMMKRFIREDFARALDEFSQTKYKHPATNEQQVEQLAKELYNDSTIRPQRQAVSLDVKAKGSDSEYCDMLEKLPGSKEELEFIDKDMREEPKYSILFDEPTSLKARYEKQVEEFREALAREDARNGDPYGDTRTDWEKAFDAGLY